MAYLSARSFSRLPLPVVRITCCSCQLRGVRCFSLFVVVVAFSPHMFSVCQHSARVDHKVSQMICSFDHCSSPYRKHVETTALKCKKGLSVLKAVAAKGIEQCHLFLLHQSVVLSVIDYGLGLTTMAQTNLLTLDRVQDAAMRSILGTTKNTPTETTRFMLDLPQADRKWVRSKHTPVPSKIPTTHSMKDIKGCRL